MYNHVDKIKQSKLFIVLDFYVGQNTWLAGDQMVFDNNKCMCIVINIHIMYTNFLGNQ